MAASLGGSYDALWDSVDLVPALQHDILSKTQLGDYELLRKLGEGEFAKVYTCRKRGESQMYAVKHISKARLICTSNIKRTLRRMRRVGTEIEAMRALKSDHICRLFDVMHSQEYVHVVMEHGGRDLYDLIGDHSGVNTTAAQTICLCLALALAHCSDRGIIHRDVKPENVLVRTKPDDVGVVESLKLCDFGLCAIASVQPSLAARAAEFQQRGAASSSDGGAGAATAESPSPSTAIATPGEKAAEAAEAGGAAQSSADAAAGCAVERDWMLSDFAGSPGFVAPEILTEPEYDGRYIDAFSLGCVLLELVLGHGAFDSVWMMAFQHDTMADPKVFSAAVVSSLTALRKMPQFSTPPEKGSKHFGMSTLTPLGELNLGLLEIVPKARLAIQAACRHPWLAATAASLAAPPPSLVARGEAAAAARTPRAASAAAAASAS